MRSQKVPRLAFARDTVSLEVERVFEVCWIAGGRLVPVQDYSWGTFTSTGQGPERTVRAMCVCQVLGCPLGLVEGVGAGALVMFFLG